VRRAIFCNIGLKKVSLEIEVYGGLWGFAEEKKLSE